MCIACAAAQTDWKYAGYSSTCPGCDVRGVAQAPKHIREKRYQQVTAGQGELACRAYRKDVLAEYQRIEELRKKTWAAPASSR